MAMIKAAYEGWPSIVIHTNCKRLIQKFNKLDSSDLWVNTALEDMFQPMEWFASCSLFLCSNELNNRCSRIASIGGCTNCELVLREAFPSWQAFAD
ncbi:hypothetical protein ACH5RR_008881 [Cinchona calisaya]|uniref:RNase H type-1 domain-containing protein n=1 Tax=Cinchona calisaya TaxID=153742 RepID=A0ABD3ACU6_9GENT